MSTPTMSEALLEKLHKLGYTARLDNGEVRIRCGKGLIAVRVTTNNPEAISIVESILPPGAPRFGREGEPGFTAFFRGKMPGQEILLADGGKIEILANGEWISVPPEA
jgi:hypothetical protein